MSTPEVVWRVRRSLRRERIHAERHRFPERAPVWWRGRLPAHIEREQEGLVADAERIAAGELCFWGRSVRCDPHALDWTGHAGDGATATAWRDWRSDLKPAWELHRQQHLVPLALAGAVADRPEWRRLAGDQMLDWIRRNPVGRRPAWSSGYETAHRLVGWAWVLPLIWDDFSEQEVRTLWDSYAAQVEYVRTTPSLYSSANNHRLMELVGLLAASTIGASLPVDRIWSEVGRQAELQTYRDGGSREQASGYFLYVLEMLWVAAVMRTESGGSPDRLEGRMRAMLDWLEASHDATGEPPPFGDDAEDRAIRLRYFLPRKATDIDARARELMGWGSAPRPSGRCRVRLLRDTGLLVINDGEDPETTVVMDVGELGFGSLGAHGHADALSVFARTGDDVLLRDSGTGTYAPAAGRDRFRLTGAHNTVTVNGESQAVAAGPHLWADRYEVVVEAFEDEPPLVYLRAAHDGYMRLPERARHTRSLTYLVDAATLVVIDRVEAEDAVAATLTWQPSPGVYPERLSEAGGSLDVGATPRAGSVRRDGPFSPRYGVVATAPRYLWSATGREVVFATVMSMPHASSAAFVRHITSSGGSAEVGLGLGDGTLTITEDWSSSLPGVA